MSYTNVINSENGDKSLPKVLIVDDHQENHRAIESILSHLDADIYYALSGFDALSLTLRHEFAVVLLDVMMPAMDGFETASLMRINEDTRNTPIIFITAMDPSDEYESKGYNVGAVDYMFKPIKPDTLAGKVNVFLELENQRRQLHQSLEDIRRLKNRNQLLLNSIGEGILGLSVDGEITFSNPAAENTLGYPEKDLLKKGITELLYVGDSDIPQISWQDTPLYQRCSQGLKYHESIGVFWNSDRELFPVEYTATPILDNEQFVGIVIAFQDITERRKTEEQLSRLAQYDTLTGLINRNAFGNQLRQALSRAHRNRSSVALLFLDLDKFKQVNDNLGHEIGDCLLQEAAVRLRECIRDGDLISRLGGDEFTVVLEAIHSGRNAAVVADKILEALRTPFCIRGHQVHIGASIGIATYPQSADDAESLMRCADIAMYKAKEEGRNKFRFFTDAMQKEVQETVSLENRLRGALGRDEFVLFYQPKVRSMTGELKGYEALIRWQPEDGAIVSPDSFITKSEEMGLIIPIGEWVFRTACQQLREWEKQTPGVTIAVNLSMRQLLSPDLLSRFEQILYETGAPASGIELEVTESMVMEDPALTIQTLTSMHQLGLKISIDDFGTGYSSLSLLRELPLDALKVDRSFIQEIGQSKQSETIVRAIIGLAHNLELKVIAEGVETAEQLSFLQDHQCDLIQGYYFCRPLPAEQVITALTSDQPQKGPPN